jgi:hypothetical protein
MLAASRAFGFLLAEHWAFHCCGCWLLPVALCHSIFEHYCLLPLLVFCHAECYENGQLVEVTHFERTALEFGGSYACRAEEGAGRSTEGLVCEPQNVE